MPVRQLSAEKLKAILSERLELTSIEVEDQSHLHSAHESAKEHGGGHYKVSLTSKEFSGKSLVERHRLVYGILDPEFKKGWIHALIIKANPPE
jgi:BolA family transcriptional regulator, general stress-responsive regulator